MSKWKIAYFCVKCKEEMSHHQVFYNYGVCPHCGFQPPFRGTIVETKDRSYKLIRINPIWKFWLPQYKRVYYGEMENK